MSNSPRILHYSLLSILMTIHESPFCKWKWVWAWVDVYHQICNTVRNRCAVRVAQSQWDPGSIASLPSITLHNFWVRKSRKSDLRIAQLFHQQLARTQSLETRVTRLMTELKMIMRYQSWSLINAVPLTICWFIHIT